MLLNLRNYNNYSVVLCGILRVTHMTENIFVVIPSLNPDEKLENTVRGMLNTGFSKIIIVNDGSNEEHLKYFPNSDDKITVIHRSRNCGKGAALKFAFRYILKNFSNVEGIVTVDGDGQHTPEDVLACVTALNSIGKGAVLGCRNFSGKNVPKRSRMGNHITSAVFKVICGMTLSDTQTGLRAFPASLLPNLIILTEFYFFRTG